MKLWMIALALHLVLFVLSAIERNITEAAAWIVASIWAISYKTESEKRS